MTEAERSPPSVRSSLAKRNEKQIAKGGEDGEETIPMGVEMIAALKKTFMRALPEEMQRLIIALKNRSVYLGSSPLTYKQDGLATEHNADFMKDEAFMKSYNLGKNTGSWRKSEIHWRAYVACWAANKAKHLEGDFVECGVYRGGLARTVMHYVDFKKLPKKFYLLDTFCGLVEECLSDDEQKRGFRELGRRYDDCYEFVRDLFKEFGNVVIIRRHRIVPEFRLLEAAPAAIGRRPYAAYRKPAGDLVRHAEHPFLHHQGFRAALRRDQRQDGARGRARSLRPPAAAQRPLVVLEHVRRAGRIFAEPGGEEPVNIIIPSFRDARQREPQMCNCTSGNLEIPGSRLRLTFSDKRYALARGMAIKSEASSTLDRARASGQLRPG